MSLDVQINNHQLEVLDTSLSLQMSLFEGLHLAAALDEQLNGSDQSSQTLVNKFYQNLLESLMLLGVRERQLLLNEASLEAMACLLRRFRGKPIAKALRENLSQRRISQVEDEAYYLKTELSAAEELSQVLMPFFNHLDQQVKESKIKLQDPKGIYF
ncbi:hypothetical protein [Marinospirillum insulare]|uniref:Uncharacterized protein n=1 Tax=Marinospirillum insulare TaxID=217169 RepID=A0ABQ5ZVN4_9GAMM|nr:hypothetical protein [Marinospirillum insulare]GLR63368.1 hypothetical protein GCM10007878_08030 [Marinospirillum insulare]